MADTAFRPYEGAEPYIFISYSHDDADRILPILTALARMGFRIWYDEGIPWTTEWPEVIAGHMKKCTVCLAFHSEASKGSRNCREELYFALGEEKTILSVYLDGVELSDGLKMRLAPYQSVKWSQFADPAAFAKRLGRERVFAPCRDAVDRDDADPSGPERRRPSGPGPTAKWHKSGQIQWHLDTRGVLTIARNRDWWQKRVVSMPDYDWDRHAAPWMASKEKIRSVVIQDDIDTIGGLAFENCWCLTSVTIPDSVSSIGESAFFRCKDLANATIPDSVSSIGHFAFYGCAGLTSVTISDSVSSIGDFAFDGCEGLTSVTIPDSVTSIGGFAFAHCVSLTSVTIPDSVTSIGDHAFKGCVSLTSVTIPDSVTFIGYSAFDGCKGLISVEIPAGVELGEDAFDDHIQIIWRP